MANPQKFTPQQVVDALRETKGMVFLAAQKLGVSYQTIYNYRDRYASVKAEIEAQNGIVGDVAEMKLFNAIIAGEPWAIQFWLRLKGKARGYVEKIETEVSGGSEPIKIKMIWGDSQMDGKE